jgi:imidazolonepropionase
MGGGIGFTVRHTHASSEAELQSLFITRLNRMIKFGTTLIEAKSGYGLILEHELKMLRVIQNTSRHHIMDIVANYCGAHSVPNGSTAAAATRDIIDNQVMTSPSPAEIGVCLLI